MIKFWRGGTRRNNSSKQTKKSNFDEAQSGNSMKRASSWCQMMPTTIAAIFDALANVCVIFTLKM
jgi:hypothetical protein